MEIESRYLFKLMKTVRTREKKAKVGTKSSDQRSIKLIMPPGLSLVTFLCFS